MKEKIEFTAEERAQYLVDRFFRGRKNEDTKKYSRAILDYLSSERALEFFLSTDTEWKWFRSKDLVNALVPDKIPHEITVFRLLDALTSGFLIERKIDNNYSGKGKKPVYYRLSAAITSPYWTMSDKELKTRADDLTTVLTVCRMKYTIAINLLESYFDDPTAEVNKRFTEQINVHKANSVERDRKRHEEQNIPFDEEASRKKTDILNFLCTDK